jgi:hypothetical protein
MCVLAQRAIRVPGTVRVEVHQLDGGAEDEQKCEKGNEQNASQRPQRPYFVAQRHN